MPELAVTLSADQARRVADQLAASLDRTADSARRVGSATRDAEKQIGGMGRSAAAANRILSRVFAVVGVAAATRAVVGYANSYTTLQNRLRAVTRSQEDLDAVFTAIQRTSSDTRTALEANVEVYARLAASAERLDLSQGELVATGRGFAQSLLLSGSSARETEAGLAKLSEAVQKGVLDVGDFDAVVQKGSVVASVLARELGVTTDQLRELAEKGEISADVLVRSFSRSGAELEEQSQRTVPTLGQAYQVASDRIRVLVGRLDEQFKISDSVAQAMLSISGAQDEVSSGGARVLTIVKGITIALGVLIALKVVDFFTSMASAVVKSTASILKMIPTVIVAGTAIATAFTGFTIGQTIFEEFEPVQQFFNDLTTEIFVFVEESKEAIDELVIAIKGLSGPKPKIRSESEIEAGVLQGRDILNRVVGLEGPIRAGPEEQSEETVQDRINARRIATQERINSILEIDRAERERIADEFAAGDSGDSSFLEAFQERAASNLLSASEIARTQVESLKAVFDDLQKLLGEPVTAEEMESLLQNKPKPTLGNGATTPGATIADPGTDLATNGTEAVSKLSFGLQTIQDAAQSAGSALGGMFEGVITGAASFEDVGNRILSTIIDVIAQALILQAIGGFGGGGEAGTGGLGALQGFFSAKGRAFLGGGRVNYLASGGILSGLTVFPGRNGLNVGGEAGDEAIFPITRNPRTGNLAVEAVGGGQQRPIQVNIATPDVEGFRRSERQTARQVRRMLEG